jgi:Alpha/beta hydrolase domain
VVGAPVDVLSGIAPAGSSIVCLLMGSTTPIAPDVLAQRYESREDYLTAYETATDDMIAAGFALEDDRDQLIDGADPSRIAAP